MKKIILFSLFSLLIGCNETFFQQKAMCDGKSFYVDDLDSWNKIKDKSIDEIVDSLSSVSGRSASDFASVSAGISDDDYKRIYEDTMKKYPDIYRMDDNDLVLVSKIFPMVTSRKDVEENFDFIEAILGKMITYDFCKSQLESQITSRGSSNYLSEKQKDLMNRNIKYVGGTLTGSLIAISETKSNYRGKSDWQTKADAFRHGCWHAFIVYSTGYVCRSVNEAVGWADRFVAAHEDNVNNLDTAMDLHNNKFSSNYTKSVAYKKGISVKMPRRKEIVSYVRRNADSAKRVGSVSEAENAESGRLVYIKEF